MQYIETNFKGLMAVVLLMSVLGMIYFLLNRPLANRLNNALGYTHFLLMVIWVICLRILQYELRIGDPPRRYYSIEGEDPFALDQLIPFISLMVIIGCVFQLVLVVNIVQAFVRKRQGNVG